MLDKNFPENKQSNILSKNTSQTNTRRSFLIKGAMVAPLIAVSTSRPVWGADDSCINSGTLSGNLSDHGCQAVGRSPGWWWKRGLDTGQWIVTGYDPGQSFHSIFLYIPFEKNGNNSTETNLETVLGDLGPSGGVSCDMHAIAAILNFSHPGIAYTAKAGRYTITNAGDVIAAYDTARSDPDPQTALNDLKYQLDTYDNSDGHDVFFNDL